MCFYSSALGWCATAFPRKLHMNACSSAFASHRWLNGKCDGNGASVAIELTMIRHQNGAKRASKRDAQRDFTIACSKSCAHHFLCQVYVNMYASYFSVDCEHAHTIKTSSRRTKQNRIEKKQRKHSLLLDTTIVLLVVYSVWKCAFVVCLSFSGSFFCVCEIHMFNSAGEASFSLRGRGNVC